MYNQNGIPNQMNQWSTNATPMFNAQYAQQNYPNLNQQTIQRTYNVIPGRQIKNPVEIRPNEVPMDGGISYFPTDDLKYIFAKQWNSDGTISTARYVRSEEPEPEQAPQKPNFEEAILERLENIEKMLTKKVPTTKKGAEASE